MFDSIRSDIYSVFASPSWVATGIKAYPGNYQGTISNKNEFARISIIPGRSQFDSHNLTKTLTGILTLSVFVKTGAGDKRLFEIADLLDDIFEGKTLQNGTQFSSSALNVIGLDRDDPALYRGDYTITFNKFGE